MLTAVAVIASIVTTVSTPAIFVDDLQVRLRGPEDLGNAIEDALE